MDAELKQKWITALRSGEWKQTKSVLRRRFVAEYCCLGVLCEVSEEGLVYDEFRGDWQAGNPRNRAPHALARGAFGLSLVDIDKLTDLNDTGSDFPAIADWIAENITEEG